MHCNIMFAYDLFSISDNSFSNLVKIRIDIIKNLMLLNEKITSFLFKKKKTNHGIPD